MQYKNHYYNNEWCESLDAVVAAPEHHRVIFENENIRVLDTRIAPGEIVPVHNHRWASVVYTLQTGEFIRFDAAGRPTLDSRVTPLDIKLGEATLLSPQLPHSIKNVGSNEMRAITIELKNQEMPENLEAVFGKKRGGNYVFKS